MTRAFVGCTGLFVLAVVLGGIISFPAISISDAADSPEKGDLKKQTVVVAEGAEVFRVEQDEFVRLTGSAIAGGEVAAKVDGPAQLVRTNRIRKVVGGQVAIGTTVTEFELKPKGKGMVKVALTKTSPIPGTKPEVETFSFIVE